MLRLTLIETYENTKFAGASGQAKKDLGPPAGRQGDTAKACA
jgi:hypothetical protein